MKRFSIGLLRVELALGLGALIGAALFLGVDRLATFANAWYWSLDPMAQQRTAHLLIGLLPLSLALGGLGWWLRRGRGQAGE